MRATVASALAGPVATIVELDDAVRSGDGVDDLHDLRVALRRLRSQLGMFRPVLDERWVDDLGAELRWIAEPTGHVRDLDVRIDLFGRKLAELGKHHQALGAMARLLDERVRARRRLIRRMESDRFAALLPRLVDASRAPVLRPGREVGDVDATMRKLARRPMKRLTRYVGELGDGDGEPTDEELHELRLLTKRARYAAETVSQLTDPRARKLARRLARLQAVLGDHQDAVVVSAALAAAAHSSDDVTEAFVLGEMSGLLRGDRRALRASWPEAWARVDDPALQEWTRG